MKKLPVKQNNNYETYNFRKPNKFSKETFSVIETIHKDFTKIVSKKLTAYINENTEINFLSVNQLTTEEFKNAIPQNMLSSQLEIHQTESRPMIAISCGIINGMINRMLGGDGTISPSDNNLSDIEKSLAKNIFIHIITALANAWGKIKQTEWNYLPAESNEISITDKAENEILAVSSFEIKLNNNFGLLTVALPYSTVKYLTSDTKASSLKTPAKTNTTEETKKIITNLQTSNVSLSAILGSANISLNNLINLKPGDVLKLDNKVTDELTLKINNQNKFKAVPGTVKNRFSVKITSPYDEAEEILKEFI